MSIVIDGKARADRLCASIAAHVAELAQEGIIPGLAVVLVGNDPASEVYVGSKIRRTEAAGMRSFSHRLPADTSEAEVLALIAQLNADAQVHGILVQLPLPRHISRDAVINAIAPEKDVDGFHVTNVGRLVTGQRSLVPCTPQGCMILLRDVLGDGLRGKVATVIGCSNIVGRPMVELLLRAEVTVLVAHLATPDTAALVRQSDIVIAAAGHPGLVRGEWIKPGATVIDVGINRVTDVNGDTRLVGDVAFADAREHAGAITPVPGGVGPMTIACLLANTLDACLAGLGRPQFDASASA